MSLNTLHLFDHLNRDAEGSTSKMRYEQIEAPRIDVREIGPRGLMVRDPYATQILNGQKTWEIRGRATQVRGPVVIVKSGTGKAFGVVDLLQVLGPLRKEELERTENITIEEREEVAENGLPYRKTYAYVFSKPKWFKSPIPYRHPNGAVTWVRLPDIDLEKAKYAAPPPSATQLRLV